MHGSGKTRIATESLVTRSSDIPGSLLTLVRAWRRSALALFVVILGLNLTACSTTKPVAGDKEGLRNVAVVVSNRAPVFQKVATHIKQDLGSNAALYYLSGDASGDTQLLNKISSLKHRKIVAIGLPAALWSKQLVGKQVVFCQVFNYRQYDLVTPSRKGVSSVPPPRQLFSRWKRLSPGLRRVIVISGPFHEGLIRKAQSAASKNGIRLDHVVVRSDKEFVYQYKKMVGRFQGTWLLPDNRVLSRAAMREVMSYSVRHGKQVMVFNPQLLPIGGLISAEPRPDDVAAQALNRLRNVAGGADIPGPDVTGLTKTRFKINKVVARQLGLMSAEGKRGGA